MIPIRTEMIIRRTPLANYAILGANVLVYAVFDMAGSESLVAFKQQYLVLNAAWPSLHQFFTYQFLHEGFAHLAGNMLFLWVFGNCVNAKMGDWTYLLFYLAAGVFAGWTFAVGNSAHLLGASGAIAGVTTAYLALFPRSRVTVLYFFFFIGFFELPATILIGLKIILWDNILAPGIQGAGAVAIEAHLGGYAFGFVAAMGMLLLRAIPRDHFDALALLDRWNRRRAFRGAMDDPAAQRAAKFGRVARDPSSPKMDEAESAKSDSITDLRRRIGESLERGDAETGASLYQELTVIDPTQCLPLPQQLTIARTFYSSGRSPQAAGAFERFVTCFPNGPESREIELLLGIIYARDLQQYAAAEKHLASSLEKLGASDRRAQCTKWLDIARQALGKPATDA